MPALVSPLGLRYGRCDILILFRDRKLQLACEDPRQCSRVFGRLAPAIQRRLTQMRASSSLGRLSLGRPHPLSGSREGQYGIGLSGNFRLVVEIAMEPIPAKDDGTADLLAVTDIRVLEVVDYHG